MKKIKRDKLGRFTKENKNRLGSKHSEGTKKILSIINKGNWEGDKNPMYNPKVLEKKSGKNHHFYGKNRSEETKEKIRKSKLGTKLSEETKRKIGLAGKGKKRTKEFKEKMRQSALKQFKNGMPKETREKLRMINLGKKLSKETIHKILKTRIENGNLYPSEETKIKLRKPSINKKIAQKKKWEDNEYRKKQLGNIFRGLELRPNKPEKLMINLIKEKEFPFNYVGDGKIWFRGKNHSFNPDFLSKNPKHIIEVFGDYWHNREDSKKRDKERLKTYSKYGYKTLIIWEHELKNSNKVINKIRGFLKC